MHLAAMPAIPLGWAYGCFTAATMLALWLWLWLTAPGRRDRREDRKAAARLAALQRETAAAETQPFTLSAEYPTAVLTPLPGTQPPARYTWEPAHHGTWPGEALRPVPQPPQTPRTKSALDTLTAAVKDPRVSDKAAVLRAAAALEGVAVTITGLPLATQLWGIDGHAGIRAILDGTPQLETA